MFAARSVFGDLPAMSESARQHAAAAIDFNFRLYSALSIASLVAAFVVAIITWRTARVSAGVTLVLAGLFVIAVVVLALIGG